MGSSISKIDDDIEAEEVNRKRQWLKKLSEEISETYVYGQEFRDLEWLFENKEKILGNRRLIDLLR